MSEAFVYQVGNRWHEILPALGVPSKFLTGKHQPCPLCGGKDRARFDNKQGRGTWFCTHCGAGDGVSLVMKMKRCSFSDAVNLIQPLVGISRVKAIMEKQSTETPKELYRELWKASHPITTDDAAGKYLFKRCGLKKFPRDLRFVAEMKYSTSEETRFFPGMIGLVRDAEGKPANIHRTFLTEDGDKAPVKSSRRMMPGIIPKGSAIRLAEAQDTLGVAEGIETAISASALSGVPVWATINDGGMRNWEPPTGVKKVLIYTDNDTSFAGQAAAYILAFRLAGKNIQVEVKVPLHDGDDWNDVHRRLINGHVDSNTIIPPTVAPVPALGEACKERTEAEKQAGELRQWHGVI